jgi:hypothetical protein
MQDTIEVSQKGASLLDLLKTMPVEHGHCFSKIDLNFVEKTLDVFQFYENVLSFDKIPIRFSNFIVAETEDSLYHLSNLLDKYTFEDNALQKSIAQFEALRKDIHFKK